MNSEDKIRKNIKKRYSEAKRIIVEAQRDGQLVLFVGAGASISAGMPSWKESVLRIAELLEIENKEITPDDYLKIPQYYYNVRDKKEYV